MNEQENNDIFEEEVNDVNASTVIDPPMPVEYSAETVEEEEAPLFCVKCGAKLESGQRFCPSCGQKMGEKLEISNNSISSKRRISLIAAVIIIAIVAIVAVVLVRGKQAKEITLNRSSVTVKVGESTNLSFTINPEDTKDKTVTWSVSNETIATVNDGKITGKNEGDCVITVSTKNGKTDTCEITVEPAGPDFNALYNEYCESSFARVASDGSYLYIDTNPSDEDDNMDYAAYLAILKVNEDLALPESVNNSMNQTRSMDGIQSASGEGFEVSWTYHPNKGLEVTYSLIK